MISLNESLAEIYDKKEIEETTTNENPMFFRIERDNRISYLLGTDHTAPFSILHPECQKIIKGASCGAGEVGNEWGGMSQDPELYRLEEEPVWSVNLPQNFVDFCLKLLKNLEFKNLSFKALAILNTAALQQLGMDAYITDFFNENKKPIYTLDFDQEETNLTVYGESIDWIENTYKEIKSIIKEMRKLKKGQDLNKDRLKTYESILKIYEGALNSFVQHGFIKELETFDSACKEYLEGNLELSEDEDKIFAELGERNYKWLPKILELHQRAQEPVVIFFGSDHLGGKYGLLNLLQESGFTIKRMNNKGIFKAFENGNLGSGLAERFALQEEAYATLRSQVLDVSANKPLSWMKSYQDHLAREQWKQWKQHYNKEHRNAKRNERNGYGAGALVVYR
ncbi:MAG TPA: TraB/GumN family protein [Gammaproteobacteria bacterium]|nr:TraB/GumN family protein [Gammaproteobacteria bacterium]